MHFVPPPTEGAARSIATPPPVRATRLNGGRPILSPIDGHDWESKVVLNPAAQLVEADRLEALMPAWGLAPEQEQALRDAGGACVMWYRAQGAVHADIRMAPSYVGRAILTPMLELVYRDPEPAISPDAAFHNLGLEDPRCTRVGDTYYLYYTGYTDPTPQDDADRHVHICLATSRDLVSWELHGPLAGELNEVNNKNSALLPEPVGDDYVLLHRPMEGDDAMSIHWATAPDPAGPWSSRGQLLASYRYREFAQSWVGAGGPPVATGDGRFLAIYHQGHFAADGTREYDLAAALLDFRRDDPVVSRIEPLMRPTGGLEVEGDDDLGVDNVLFSCANHVWQGDLVVPYAGADSRIFGAALPYADLLAALEDAADDAGGGA